MPGPQAEQRGGDRKPHRAERPEADQQDHDRGGDPDDASRIRARPAAPARSPGRRARPGGSTERADSAVVMTRSTAAFGSALARSSKLTVANAIVPSREIACCAGGVRADDARDVGQARRRARASRRSSRGRPRSVSLPVRAWKTIWSASPACAGKRLLQQVDRVLRAGAREREVARGLLSDRARDREDPDRGDDPGDHDDPAVGHCPASDVHH